MSRSFIPSTAAAMLIGAGALSIAEGSEPLLREPVSFSTPEVDSTSLIVQNLGLAGFGCFCSERLVVFLVEEFDQGVTDLNGDGDTVDEIVHVHDLENGATSSLSLAAPTAVVAGPLVAFPVDESSQGVTDLNADGDTNDLVLHVYDARSGTTTNTELAVLSSFFRLAVHIDGDDVAFLVAESSAFGGSGQGVDLNGDGDVGFDQVLHVYDAQTRATTNLGIASTINADLKDRLLVFHATEATQGGTDLNGDGDAQDGVAHVYDVQSGKLANLALASTVVCRASGGLSVIFASEGGQGDADLNGDGDAADAVLHTFDSSDGLVNKGIAVQSSELLCAVGTDFVAVAVPETLQALTDLNGDGDTGDVVLHVLDVDTKTLVNQGLAIRIGGSSAAFPQVQGDLLSFLVPEQGQAAADLNGDGDAFDEVTHYYLGATGECSNVGVAADAMGLGDGIILMRVLESQQGNADLNGNGSTNDRVLHYHSVCLERTFNLGLASTNDYTSGGSYVAFAVRESAQGGGSLNGDSDTLDDVFHVHPARSGATVNTALAADFLAVPRDGVAVFFVDELSEGADFNGDGDNGDRVAHLLFGWE